MYEENWPTYMGLFLYFNEVSLTINKNFRSYRNDWKMHFFNLIADELLQIRPGYILYWVYLQITQTVLAS